MAGVAVHTERIDDVPLLFHQQRQMRIAEVLDAVIQPHGNRNGLSVGSLTTLWLSFILSESDHRMSEVEPWVGQQMNTVSGLVPGLQVSAKDFTDDRLADVLRQVSDDDTWVQIETLLGKQLIGVYNLKRDFVRLDSTAAAVYHDSEGSTFFLQGHTKDHRPDLAQFKVMLATLDPLGMPLATLVVPGNEADDGLYIPTVREARKVLGKGSQLYIGDSKMGALATRGFIKQGGDYYLTPLAASKEVKELIKQLLEPVWRREQEVDRIYRPVPASESEEADIEEKLLGVGFESKRPQQVVVNGKLVKWNERILVIFSPQHAKRSRKGLQQRLDRAQNEIEALTPPRGRGRRQYENLQDLQKDVAAILKKRKVEDLLVVEYHQEVEEKTIRKYRDRPERIERRVRYVVEVKRNHEAIRKERQLLGWRLYVTNAPRDRLPLTTALCAYRDSSLIERNFLRLKGKPLGIRPLYVQREDHTKGMARLLSLALRVLTVVEHVVREGLQAAEQALSGLYAGNPKRKTRRPTTERLLKAFKGIYMSVVDLGNQTVRHVTPLNALQKRILDLLGLPGSIYEVLAQARH